MVPVLYVIRHGRTSYNQKGLFRGEADIPLTDQGFKDADEVAEFLKDVTPSFIVSSDKKRAVQTATVLAKNDGMSLMKTELLRAWNLGEFSGKPKNKENLAELDKYIKDPDLQVPGGESLNEFRDRILPVLAECFEQATREGVGFVIAHSSVVHEIGGRLYGNHKTLVVKPGGIVVLGFGDGDIVGERIFKPLRNEKGDASVS
jgi:broad specificity phosphatase PhoE